MAEASYVGYSTTGALTEQNDLYRGSAGGHLDDDQNGTILGEYRKFSNDPINYVPGFKDCIGLDICDVWNAHESHRLDPKYHLFKVQEEQTLPDGWVSKKISELMQRREEVIRPEESPETPVTVMTLSQTGDIRPREAGKGKNPPEWLGMYFADSPSTWFKAHQGDLVYSSINTPLRLQNTIDLYQEMCYCVLLQGGEAMNETLRLLYNRFYTPLPMAESEQVVETCHRQLIERLDKPERKDATDHRRPEPDDRATLRG